MTRSEILDAIRKAHVDFLTAIGGIPDDEMMNEPVAEELTVKDLLGHITLWMQVSLNFIAEYKHDGLPKPLGLKDDAALDAFNARGWEARRETPLVRVIADYHAAYRDLIAAVESLSDAELSTPLPAPWEEGDTLEKLIAINSYEHVPEHTLQVHTWREQQDEEHEDE